MRPHGAGRAGSSRYTWVALLCGSAILIPALLASVWPRTFDIDGLLEAYLAPTGPPSDDAGFWLVFATQTSQALGLLGLVVNGLAAQVAVSRSGQNRREVPRAVVAVTARTFGVSLLVALPALALTALVVLVAVAVVSAVVAVYLQAASAEPPVDEAPDRRELWRQRERAGSATAVLLLLVVAASVFVLVRGVGSDGGAVRGTEATAPTGPTSSRPHTNDANQNSVVARNRLRGQQLLDLYGEDRQVRWSVASMRVSGGRVTVRTDLVAESANAGKFRDACSALIDQAPWIASVAIVGANAKTYATWGKGASVCKVSI